MAAKVSKIESVTESAEVFGGIDRSNGTPLGYWQELKGLDFTAYPALRTCKPFSYTELPDGITGYMFKNGGIVYTKADGIYIDGKKTAVELSTGEKRLVGMGAYILILPDEALINTADDPISVTYPTRHELKGSLYEYNQNQTRPTVAIFKRLYIDVAKDSAELSYYSEGNQIKIAYSYGGKTKYLTARIKSISEESYTSSGCISINLDTSVYNDTLYFYTEGRRMENFRVVCIKNATVSRQIPQMDFIVEHNNRLWGCSSADHEIYCSKLGSAVEWGNYDGISTDAWAATVGSDGDFTGACVYANSVLFFKENCVHIVYGTKASNFTVSTIKLRGVQSGSGGSLCISDGLLYYKAPEGLFCFNGSAAHRIDSKLGGDITDTAVMTADGRYIVMAAADGTVYFYDKRYAAWYERRLSGVCSAHEINGRLYAVAKGNSGKLTVTRLVGTDSDAKKQAENSFEAVSGDIGRGKVFNIYKKLRAAVRYSRKDNEVLRLSLYVSGDGGEWKKAAEYNSAESKSEEITAAPIIPLRCKTVRIKISGKTSGDAYAVLYGVYLDSEKGSEISG